MALNLAIHKSTITDDGGSVAATQANINGLHDEDTPTNVLEIAADNTFYLHYDFGAPYQVSQLRIYASVIDTAYWTVQCSNNDVAWTTETVVDGGTYIYVNIDDGYRYIRIRCDTTGKSALSIREYEIDADSTLMKYQAGSSGVIGSTTDSGTLLGVDTHDVWFGFIDTENPAPSDGYLVALTGFVNCTGPLYDSRMIVYILTDAGTRWTVKQKYVMTSTVAIQNMGEHVFSPPLKFEAGDLICCAFKPYGGYFGRIRRASSVGKSYKYKVGWGIVSVGDSIMKTDFTTVSDYELRVYSKDHMDITANKVGALPISDRNLTGNPGASTDPRVVNTGAVDGISPTLGFYPVTSSLSAGINDSQTTLAVNDAQYFPQAAAGAEHGGEIRIGSEEMSYTYINGNTFNGLLRGINGTSAAAHSQWDIVENMTPYIEISVDDSTFKAPRDAGLPLSLGADINAGVSKTFYIRANPPFEYQDDKQIYSRIHVVWSV